MTLFAFRTCQPTDLLDLNQLRFIESKERHSTWPPGVGKTHLAVAPVSSHQPATVLSHSLKLGNQLYSALADGSSQTMNKLPRNDPYPDEPATALDATGSIICSNWLPGI